MPGKECLTEQDPIRQVLEDEKILVEMGLRIGQGDVMFGEIEAFCCLIFGEDASDIGFGIIAVW